MRGIIALAIVYAGFYSQKRRSEEEDDKADRQVV